MKDYKSVYDLHLDYDLENDMEKIYRLSKKLSKFSDSLNLIETKESEEKCEDKTSEEKCEDKTSEEKHKISKKSKEEFYIIKSEDK